MNELLPGDREFDLRELYADLTLVAGVDRAHIAVGMVSTLDGAATVEGRTDALGGEADAVAFRRLRDACDAIVVGAGTVRAENYRRPSPSQQRRDARVSRGLQQRPRLVVVTSSVDLDPGHRVFTSEGDPVIVVTHEAAPVDRLGPVGDGVEVVTVGEHEVDLRRMATELAARGLRRVLCEGGPTLNAALLADDLVDEIFLTVAPKATGGTSSRIIAGPQATSRDFELVSAYEHEGELLVRYARRR